MKVEASAPSNIALIKYMGKTLATGNIPTNASLSYTLEHLRSFVTLESAGADSWQPLAGLPELKLSQAGQDKSWRILRCLKPNGKFLALISYARPIIFRPTAVLPVPLRASRH
jgi:diphosphomevalonate decarboxylase